jgi:hypothetical protein
VALVVDVTTGRVGVGGLVGRVGHVVVRRVVVVIVCGRDVDTELTVVGENIPGGWVAGVWFGGWVGIGGGQLGVLDASLSVGYTIG